MDGFDPHEPWDPPRAYADMYMPDYEGKEFIWPGMQGPEATEEEIERIRALYFGEVTFVDSRLGRFLEQIDELKLWDNTMVVFTSDHGTQVLDHGAFGKSPNNLRQYLTRIALHIHHPNGPQGVHIDGLVQAHDLAPTVLTQLGVPAEMDGMDFWPLVTGESQRIRDHVVIAWADWAEGRARGRVSVRDDEWNYVVGTGYEDESAQLYDLENDPNEDTNVVHQHPEVLAKQRARIEVVLKQPLPGLHEEVCTREVVAPAHMCRRIQFARQDR